MSLPHDFVRVKALPKRNYKKRRRGRNSSLRAVKLLTLSAGLIVSVVSITVKLIGGD